MGYTTSTVHGIEVPDSSEANDVPEDIGKVVTALEGGSIVRRLTSAAIAALTAPQKPAGLVVYNTTTGKLQVSNGTSFADVDAALGVWQSWTCAVTASGSNPTGVTQVGSSYTRIGDLVTARGAVTVPIATKGSGSYYFSLPVNMASVYAASIGLMPVGFASKGDTAAILAFPQSASTIHLQIGANIIGSEHMIGDDRTFSFQVTYEAA